MSRRAGREVALKTLFQVDLVGSDPAVALPRMVSEERADAAAAAFARELVEGVLAHREEIDGWVGGLSAEWEVGRMATVDRNVLRIACYELAFQPDVPPGVAINEAIDLAKLYSTPESGKFVNGILGTLLKRLVARRGQAGAAGPRAERGNGIG